MPGSGDWPVAVLLAFLFPAMVGIALVWTTIQRFIREPGNRGSVVMAGVAAWLVWAVLTAGVLFLTFVTAWGVAHADPPARGPFPEGWPIYVTLAVYALLGGGLVFLMWPRSPRERSGESRTRRVRP